MFTSYTDDQTEEGDVRCFLHVWSTEEVRSGFWWRDLREREHLETVGVDERIILKMYLQEMGWVGMKWINLAQDTERWLALVNSVMR